MTDGRAVIEMRDIRKRFGTNEVLKGITLSVERGEVLAIIGPSGSGKSTLARCISLIEEPDHGEIRFLDCRLVHEPAQRLTLAARWRRTAGAEGIIGSRGWPAIGARRSRWTTNR